VKPRRFPPPWSLVRLRACGHRVSLEPYQFEFSKRGFYLMDMFAYRL